MVYVLADNIISPLGTTSEENYLSVKAGKSGIRVYAPGSNGLPDGFAASLMNGHFEDLAFRSAMSAMQNSAIDVSNKRTIFILSTTKGDIDKQGKKSDGEICLGDIAQRIAMKLGINTQPLVVCNACISGLSALILANRLLEADKYDYAVVCGCDCPGHFVISGFQSLKALSSVPCRPFDIERLGLNLGEAAATVVLGRNIPAQSSTLTSKKSFWQIKRGSIKNDAFHISTPSKTGEGLYKALEDIIDESIDNLAFVNTHGTATMFNDQMESVAIQRAGLSDVPANALKGYLGHTLGAAGVLETILSMKASEDHTVIGTLGYEEPGISGKVNMSATHRPTDKTSFIKMLSGFGGCNAAIWADMQPANTHCDVAEDAHTPTIVRRHRVQISPDSVIINGQRLCTDGMQENENLLTFLYKHKIGDYPKYYKMDGLSRLGFVASELLLQAEHAERFIECDNRAVILFNRTSTISTDKKYLESISDKDNYFPSPSLFVYTLPNIVTGEIAIRNHYHGETSFYVLQSKDETMIWNVLETAFMDKKTESVLTGWIDYENDACFEAELYILEKK